MPHVFGLVALLFVVAGVRLPGQGWVDRTGPNGPAPRWGHAMCYDPTHGYTLMVSDSSQSSGGVSDAWSWDGSAWTSRGPTPSNMKCLVWHAGSGQLLGMAYGMQVSQWSLYSWNGISWAGVASLSEQNGGVCSVSGCYDLVRNECVFRPLWSSPGQPGCVIVFDGVTLQKRVAASGPINIFPYNYILYYGYESMTWGPVAQRALLVRDDNDWLLVGSTWIQVPALRFYEWSGYGWNVRYPATKPSRCGPLATDTARQRVILLDAEWPGYQSPGANQPNHTWAIANGVCTSLTTPLGPIPRNQSAMAFDPVRGVCVLFGGNSANAALGDTWEFDLGPLASFTSYGTGCVGSRGIPSITAQAASTPRIGSTFTAQVNGLPWTGPAFLFLGLSDTSYSGTPLPFNLGILGAPGCNLLTSCEQLHLLTNVLGSAQWSFQVPPVPGASFYTQVFPLDPVNALGLTASNGGRGVIGL